MATATLKKVTPKVLTTVTLELSEREAQLLRALIGSTEGAPVSELHSIYYDLDKGGITTGQFKVTSGNIRITETK